MGKQGPCCHCGISTTPLWRNGPPEKPVLCNACGSRWRTKGTLLNYMPMHSGGFGGTVVTDGSGDIKWPRGKKGGHKPSSEPRSHKRKEPSGPTENCIPLRRETSLSKVPEEEVTPLGVVAGLPRQTPLAARKPTVPSPLCDVTLSTRKRSVSCRSRASFENVTKHFLDLIYEPPACTPPLNSSCVSSESLLVEYNPPLGGFEIGLGSVLLYQAPMILQQDLDSELSSILIESSGGGEALEALTQGAEARFGGPLMQLPNGVAKPVLVRGKEKLKQITRKMESGGRLHTDRSMISNKALLENFPYNKRDVLQSSQSPLVFLEMKDIVNFDTFTGLLTEQEQGQLMKFVSTVDLARVPDSLKGMFNSAQFEGALANFQQLLSEGMFDSAELGLNPRVLQHFQQLLNVTDLTGSGWMERCSQLQHRSKRRGGSADFTKNKEGNKDKFKGFGLSSASTGFASARHSPIRVPSQLGLGAEEEPLSYAGFQKQNSFSGCQSPLSVHGNAHGGYNPLKHSLGTKTGMQDVGSSSNDGGGAYFPGSSLLLGDRGYGGVSMSVDDLPDIQVPGSDGTESDLLFDVPSNMMSFHQAEILQQPSWTKSKEENDLNQVENGSLIMSNTWHMDTNPSDWGGLFFNPSCTSTGCALPNGTVLNPGRMLM